MAQKGYRRQRKDKNGKNRNDHDALGVLLIAISLFLLLCIIIPPILSVVSQAIFSIVLGVFGIISYPVLIAVFLWGVNLLLRRSLRMTAKNIVCIALIIVFALIILQLASTHAFLDKNYSAYIADTYSVKYSAGGVIFGTIAFGLKSAITEVGCYIVFSLAILVVVAIMTNLVARIRARKSSVAPVDMVKMPPAPTFGTRTTPQSVMPVEGNPGLFVGTIERKAPPVAIETGRASDIPPENDRMVTDYSDTPVITDIDEKQSRSGAKTTAAHTLYGDSEAIKRKSAEEYIRASENAYKSKPVQTDVRYEESTSDVYAQKREDIVEPYIRTAHDAQANTASRPKKIVHESHDVFFPVEKNLEFNDDGIENADDIIRKLREDTQKRKMSDIGAIESKPEPIKELTPNNDRRSNPPEVFMPIKQTPVRPPEPETPIIDVDLDRGNTPAFEPLRPIDHSEDNVQKHESADDRFLRTFGSEKSAKPQIPLFEPEKPNDDVQDDIINTDIVRGTSFASTPEPEDYDVNPDDIIVGDVAESEKPDVKPEPVFSETKQSSVFGAPAAEPAPDGDDGIIDSMEGLKIDNGPAVDMSEKHDITSDLIVGDDLSGMYVNADDEMPVQKSKKSRLSAPLDNQISIQSLIEQKSDESVVVNLKRHKRYGNYTPPPIDLLKGYSNNEMTEDELQRNAAILEKVIGGFLKSEEVKVVRIVPGPTVTRYEIECPMGVPVKQIEAHSSDIEYELAALSHIRIEAPIPGKRAVGIEVPNAHKSIVGIREIIESEEYIKAKSPMTFAVGKGISGDVVLCDLEKVPHLLIAGQTGSGKSACLNGLIISLLYKSSPEDLRFVLVDPKRVEFSAYAGMPHLLFNNIIYEPNEVLNALKWAANEMERRYTVLQKYRCNQLSSFNKHPDVVSGKIDRMSHIIIIIDELADIMQSAVKRDIEDKIKVIAAKARAAGIHLIVATQRPSADVLTGTIKTNLTSRIAFKVSGQTDSRIILDVQGAEALVGKGDMLFFPVEYSAPKRVQGSFISDEEVASVLGYIKDNVECDFDEEAANAVFGNDDVGGAAEAGMQKAKGDPLLPDVLALFIKTKQASTSTVQRRFSIGYARASRIMDIMEELKYIGPVTGNSKPREVYITNEQYRELFGHDVDEN